MNYPKISIVTPTFNQGQFIEQTIQSVLVQEYPNLEYNIIDGGSTDNTIGVIKKYEKHLKFWVSEKDKGQAHAINKGLMHCTGEIFNWLNSDDYLEPGALYIISDTFKNNAQMVAGKVRLFDSDKTIEYVQHAKLSAEGLMNWLPGVQFVQPGVWMKRDLISRCGGIEETLHYSFDWDLYIRYLSKFPRIKYTDNLLIHFRYHDMSKTVSSLDKFHQEELLIIKKLSTQKEDIKLQKIALGLLSARQLRSSLKIIANDSATSRLKKLQLIMQLASKNKWVHYRTTGCAFKKAILGKKI